MINAVERSQQHTGLAISYQSGDALYLNITNRCTLRCRFCPKFNRTWTVADTNLRLPKKNEPTTHQIVNAVRNHSQYKTLVFCGLGEPTTRLSTVVEVATALRTKGCITRLNTDGLANLLHGYDVVPYLSGIIDAVSISLNAHNETLYKKYCRPRLPGSFQSLLAFADRCRQLIPQVRLTAIDGLDGVDINKCMAIAKKLDVSFRARPLEPTDGRTFRIR